VSRLRFSRRQATGHLRDHCVPLRRFIDRIGPLGLRARPTRSVFEALAAAIVYQQLSGRAARSIHGRFVALFDGAVPTPAAALGLSVEELRAAGLSHNKSLAVRDLAGRCLDHSLPQLRGLARLGDDEVIARLSEVRGIGAWTAQMFLIFNLGRPDVMPATDLGVQKGVQVIYGIGQLPGPGEVLARTAHLAPFRSAASWYFWRAADTQLLA
jgi:3-methyladenine DNA glycosylase/8-oxoguanine DNA glycosylase